MTTPDPTFEDAVAQLMNEEADLTKEMLAFFSDIFPAQLKTLQADWGTLSAARRQEFVSRLSFELETDTLLNFDLLAQSLLLDDDPFVRSGAVRLLREHERDDIIPALLAIAQNDPETEPRAEAITALGGFVLRGELDEIAKESLQQVEEALLALAKGNEKNELRQRALESLGFSSNAEVKMLIEEAWERDLPRWKASAVFAMGRTCDSRWRDQILEGLVHENELVRLAATRAAGELELGDARPLMLNMLREESDEAVFRALVWSLSEIGGEDVREHLLSLIDQYEDDEEAAIEYVEEALANLDFTEDLQDFDFLNYDEDDPLEE